MICFFQRNDVIIIYFYVFIDVFFIHCLIFVLFFILDNNIMQLIQMRVQGCESVVYTLGFILNFEVSILQFQTFCFARFSRRVELLIFHLEIVIGTFERISILTFCTHWALNSPFVYILIFEDGALPLIFNCGELLLAFLYSVNTEVGVFIDPNLLLLSLRSLLMSPINTSVHHKINALVARKVIQYFDMVHHLCLVSLCWSAFGFLWIAAYWNWRDFFVDVHH